ncbi:MAG: hypothetical protein MJ211_10000 [Bacteroidales bacterium]|nr:hypothetical protein [Bacteroidales bacterium]
MEEATIQDVSTETSQEVTTENDTVSTDTTSQEVGEQQQDTSNTENQETATTETKPSVDYEKQYKELQAEYTRKSQEFADFKRQHQPQVVDESGKPTSQFEQRFEYDLTNYEFSSYKNLSRYLDVDDRQEVESLLDRANNCYIRGDKRNYDALLNEVKEHFNPQYIEAITEQKALYKAQKQQYINNAVNEQRQASSIRVAQEVEKVPELNNLINPDSANYSQPVFDVMHQLFNLTGGLDVNMATNAIKAIKEVAIKEYQATQAIEKQKRQAGVLSGDNAQTQSQGELSMNDKAFWEKRYS